MKNEVIDIGLSPGLDDQTEVNVVIQEEKESG